MNIRLVGSLKNVCLVIMTSLTAFKQILTGECTDLFWATLFVSHCFVTWCAALASVHYLVGALLSHNSTTARSSNTPFKRPRAVSPLEHGLHQSCQRDRKYLDSSAVGLVGSRHSQTPKCGKTRPGRSAARSSSLTGHEIFCRVRNHHSPQIVEEKPVALKEPPKAA